MQQSLSQILSHWIKLWWQLFCIFDKRKHSTCFGLWILVELRDSSIYYLMIECSVECLVIKNCKCNILINRIVISTHNFTAVKRNKCLQINVRPKRSCSSWFLVHFFSAYLVVWSVLLRVLEISFWLVGWNSSNSQ